MYVHLIEMDLWGKGVPLSGILGETLVEGQGREGSQTSTEGFPPVRVVAVWSVACWKRLPGHKEGFVEILKGGSGREKTPREMTL